MLTKKETVEQAGGHGDGKTGKVKRGGGSFDGITNFRWIPTIPTENPSETRSMLTRSGQEVGNFFSKKFLIPSDCSVRRNTRRNIPSNKEFNPQNPTLGFHFACSKKEREGDVEREGGRRRRHLSCRRSPVSPQPTVCRRPSQFNHQFLSLIHI